MNSVNRRVALVTGANGGIGREICEALLSAGCYVIFSCRSREKSISVFNGLCGKFGDDRLEMLVMDLSSLSSVTEVAAALVSRGIAIDILINNAGMLGWKPQVTAQGYEMHYAVNCLHPIFFTWLLKPLLHKGSRVVNTASCTVYLGTVPNKFPLPPGRFARIKRYSDSKYALLLLSLKLARIWESDGITVNVSDPGIVNTPIITMHKWFDPLTDVLFRPVIRQAPEGAATTVFLALDPSVGEKTAGFYANKQSRRLPSRVAGKRDADRLWSFFLTLLHYGNKQ